VLNVPGGEADRLWCGSHGSRVGSWLARREQRGRESDELWLQSHVLCMPLATARVKRRRVLHPLT
jgi:hypothetical protein